MTEDEMKKLLRESLGRTDESADAEAGPARNLWPGVLRRITEEPAARAGAVPWFDWALLAALAVAAAAFPAAIPVFLYYM